VEAVAAEEGEARELEVGQEAVVVVEDVAARCKLELLASRMTTPFLFGDPGARPNPVRKFYMKPLLPRRKQIRTRYRELVSGGGLRRGNCWLRFHTSALRYPSYILEPPFLCTDCANAVLRIRT
jgi:hypothetical protein